MDQNDHRSSFKGKPAKSIDEIRRVLTSIHQANPPRPVGPFAAGLPEAKRRAVSASSVSRQSESRQLHRRVRNHVFYRQLLLAKGAFVGGFSGGLLGFNIGVATAIITGWHIASPFAAVLGLLFGSAVGIVLARSTIVQRRNDLFTKRISSTRALGNRAMHHCAA